jgi:hypothetical protein
VTYINHFLDLRRTDIYATAKVHPGRESISIGIDPELRATIASEVINPLLNSAMSDTFKECISRVGDALNAGQLSTVSDMKRSLGQQLDHHQVLMHQHALGAFSEQCNGAAAMHAGEVVGWLIKDSTKSCTAMVVPGNFQRRVEPCHQEIPDVDTAELPSLAARPLRKTQLQPVQALSNTKTVRRRRMVEEHRARLADNVEEKLKCGHDGCQVEFSGLPADQRTNLKRHVDSTHLGKRWRCETCDLVRERRDYIPQSCREQKHRVSSFTENE